MIGLSRLSAYASCIGLAAFVLSGCGTKAKREPATVLINELVPRNGPIESEFESTEEFLTAGDSDYVDWIELYNAADSAVDLSDHSLGDSLEPDAARVRFGPGVTILSDKVLQVWTHDDTDPVPPIDSEEIHLVYTLSGTDDLYLFSPEGEVVDAVSYVSPPQRAQALARFPNGAEGQWAWCPTASPNKKNQDTCEAQAAH